MNIEPSGRILGARVTGIDIAQPLAASDFASIFAALGKFGVLCFPAQKLDAAHLRDFAQRFGRIQGSVTGKFHHPQVPEVGFLSNVMENGKPIGLADAGQDWHTDMTYNATVGFTNVLYAVKVPRRNGKALGATQFANMHAAYDDLDPALKTRVATVLRDQVIPAYRKLHRFFTEEYYPRTRETIGISAVPNGEAWYNYLVRSFTTTDMSADQIHQRPGGGVPRRWPGRPGAGLVQPPDDVGLSLLLKAVVDRVEKINDGNGAAGAEALAEALSSFTRSNVEALRAITDAQARALQSVAAASHVAAAAQADALQSVAAASHAAVVASADALRDIARENASALVVSRPATAQMEDNPLVTAAFQSFVSFLQREDHNREQFLEYMRLLSRQAERRDELEERRQLLLSQDLQQRQLADQQRQVMFQQFLTTLSERQDGGAAVERLCDFSATQRQLLQTVVAEGARREQDAQQRLELVTAAQQRALDIISANATQQSSTLAAICQSVQNVHYIVNNNHADHRQFMRTVNNADNRQYLRSTNDNRRAIQNVQNLLAINGVPQLGAPGAAAIAGPPSVEELRPITHPADDKSTAVAPVVTSTKINAKEGRSPAVFDPETVGAKYELLLEVEPGVAHAVIGHLNSDGQVVDASGAKTNFDDPRVIGTTMLEAATKPTKRNRC